MYEILVIKDQSDEELSEASLLLRAFFLIFSFNRSLSAWSSLSSLFMLVRSRLKPFSDVSTWFSFKLLFLISSIRLALLWAKLPCGARSDASIGGGGGGGGRPLTLLFLKAAAYFFSSSCASLSFLCKFGSIIFSAWLFACCIMVSSTIMLATSLFFRSFFDNLSVSKISCH